MLNMPGKSPISPKVALLISGHTRSIQDTVNNILRIKEMLSCDIFLHQWTVQDMSMASWRSPEKYEPGEFSGELLQSVLKPKACIVEDAGWVLSNLFPKLYGDRKSTGFIGGHYMIYGIIKCFMLCEDYSQSSGEKYDVVIRYRYDLICLDPQRLLFDVLEVFSDNNLVKMPDHNWAASVGAYFDGVIVAEIQMYSKIVSDLPIKFDKSICGLINSAMVFPELFIVRAIQGSGAKVNSSNSRIRIIRKHGKCDQEFKPISGIFEKYVSLYKTYRYVRGLSIGDPHVAINSNWGVNRLKKYSLFFALVFVIERSIRRIVKYRKNI
jgi:hypothetical protein